MVSTEIKDTGKIISELSRVLPDFIVTRRWYRAKARTIKQLRIQDTIPMPGLDSNMLVVRINYLDGGNDSYLLPVSFGRREDFAQASAPDEVITSFLTSEGAEEVVYGAFSSAKFRNGLIPAIACGMTYDGHDGDLVASHTSAFSEQYADTMPVLESFVSRAEQSNTSVIYQDRFILKLFRKLEPGINPDVEIGRFLTERKFRYTPAVLGAIEYRAKQGDSVCAAAILQEFVRNQGDAWKYTLESLAGFFRRTGASEGKEAPELENHHPLELINSEVPPQVQELIGPYLESARLLGTRTAQMHAALADPDGGPDFAPEPFTPADGEKLYRDMLGQANIAFELLERKQPALAGTTAVAASELLQIEHRVTDRFAPLREYPITTARIRHHGDYHLGQVLYTGDDFKIIDFEGEPARELAERRLKTIAMRDVAGMIRSFQYAGYAALFGQVSGVPVQQESMDAVESWAALWTAWVSAAYLQAYFAAANGLPFLAAKNEERRLLFDAFLLQKALYEVAYELNNRPDWVRIPLRGILSLMS
jgi:maltose alpha-D-glucosyltransferase / alpha-amylase